MEKEQFKELTYKLNLITRLLALNLVKDMKTQSEKIIVLASFGFGPSNIAEMLGTSNTVSVALSNIRSKKKKQPLEDTTNKESDKQEIKATDEQQIKL